MNYHHWQYFLALESDLEATSRFVEFSTDNFSTYSIEFAKILLSSSSEIDVVAKALCSNIDPSGNFRNINDCRTKIVSEYDKFPTIEVILPRYNITLKPWEAWQSGSNPNWWTSYNLVKHHRDSEYKKANLENSLLSVAGLFALVLYYYKEHLRDEIFFGPHSFPRIMLLHKYPDPLYTGGWELPD